MSQNSETVVNSQGLTYTIESMCQYQYFQIGREFVFKLVRLGMSLGERKCI